jgi:HEPN domain-containing protein
MSVREITLEWVAKAEEDASVSERESRVRKQPSPGAVCYHAQQCIEKYLKAVLQEQGRPIPKTHDLTSLSKQCQFNPLCVPVECDGLVSLTRFATRFRYPGEAATGEDAKLAIALMRRYRAALREFLGL